MSFLHLDLYEEAGDAFAGDFEAFEVDAVAELLVFVGAGLGSDDYGGPD